MIVSVTPDQLQNDLQQFVQPLPFLEPLIPTYVAFLRLEQTTAVPPLPVEWLPSEANALLERGIPLLQRDAPPLVLPAMEEVWRQVCDIAARPLEPQAERLRAAQEWPRTQREEWLAALDQYFRDGELSLDDSSEKSLLTFLMVHTWRPFLLRWANDLASLLNDGLWGKKSCPVCGGQPDFACLRPVTGERRLFCSRCDTEWHFDRVGCPFCGNQDPASYGYYSNEDSPYRLYVCNECRRYLKTLDLRQVIGERVLPVERIASSGIDMSALQAGYRNV